MLEFYRLLVVICFLSGSILALLAAIGMLRLNSFYKRLHMSSIINVGALIFVVMAVFFAKLATSTDGLWRILLALVFIFFASPLNNMLLARGAFYREFLFYGRHEQKIESKEEVSD